MLIIWNHSASGYNQTIVRNTESILIEALQLPVQERAALPSRLLASLDEQVDESVDAAGDAEIAKRLKDIDEGKVQMVPGGEVMKRMRRITRGSRSMAEMPYEFHPDAQAEVEGTGEW